MQYHNTIDKETGRTSYKKLTEQLLIELEGNDKARECGCQVKFGTYLPEISNLIWVCNLL